MTEVEITPSSLIVHIKGLDKLWTFKSQLELPLSHITGAVVGIPGEVWAELQESLLHRHQDIGSYIPGRLIAGSYLGHKEWMFWDVHNQEKALTLSVTHEEYKQVVLEVADPAATVAAIQQAIAKVANPGR